MPNKRKNEVTLKEKCQNDTFEVARGKHILTLDEIEEEMDKVVVDTEPRNMFSNQKRLDMLSKVADFKLKKAMALAQLESLKPQQPAAPQPIEVKFVSSKTKEEDDRIAKIEEEIELAVGNDGKA